MCTGGHAAATFDRICSGLRPPFSVQHDLDLLAHLATLGKPGAKVTICQAVSDQVRLFDLKIKKFGMIHFLKMQVKFGCNEQLGTSQICSL